MAANLLGEAGSVIAVVGVAFSSISWALASLVKKIVEERSRTARFTAALKGSKPHERGEIIRAWGQLESRRAGELGEASEAPGRADRSQPPAA